MPSAIDNLWPLAWRIGAVMVVLGVVFGADAWASAEPCAAQAESTPCAGAGESAQRAAVDDDCAGACPGERADGECDDNCQFCSCCSTSANSLLPRTPSHHGAPLPSAPPPPERESQLASGVASGIFKPPRQLSA